MVLEAYFIFEGKMAASCYSMIELLLTTSLVFRLYLVLYSLIKEA
jgi:hypothetical protein